VVPQGLDQTGASHWSTENKLERRDDAYFLLQKVLLFLNISVINRQMEILISLLQVLCGYVPHLCRFALTLSSGRTVHFLPVNLPTNLFPQF
jgi:hypothetical protein